MNARTKLIAVGAACVLGGMLVGGTFAWVAQQQRVSDAERTVRRVAEQAVALDRTNARLAEQLSASRPGSATATASAASQSPTDEPNVKITRKYAYLRQLEVGPPAVALVDYAKYLTGRKAAAAAKAAGSESPPPNDYFIVNDDTELTTLKVDPRASVRLTTKPEVGQIAEGYATELATLAAYLTDASEETASIKSDGYWLTLADGVVIAIEEQYQP